MSDKAFKVTAGAIGALAMAVVVRSLVTPSTVEVQTGARVVCSQCGKTISESITTVEVRESEAASRKVTETKAVCEQCATRSAQAAAQRARPVPQLVGPPKEAQLRTADGATTKGAGPSGPGAPERHTWGDAERLHSKTVASIELLRTMCEHSLGPFRMPSGLRVDAGAGALRSQGESYALGWNTRLGAAYEAERQTYGLEADAIERHLRLDDAWKSGAVARFEAEFAAMERLCRQIDACANGR